MKKGYNIAMHICEQWAGTEKLALIDAGDRNEVKYSFKDIKKLSDRLGNVLLGLGIRQGDRVAILLPQGVELAISYLGILKIGALSVAFTTMFGPEALKVRLADCGARLVITNGENEWKVEDIRKDLPDLQGIIVVGAGNKGKLDFYNLLQEASTKLEMLVFEDNAPAIIAYTSGTTGTAKGVLHSHRSFPGRLPGFKMAHNYFPEKENLFWTPADWTWIGGLFDGLFSSWACGIPILAYKSKKFDPERALEIIYRYGVKNAFIPPAALRMMAGLNVSKKYSGILKSVHSGGESLPAEFIEWGEKVLGVTIHEVYGLTECSLLVGNCKLAYPVRPGSIGKPYPGRLVEVMDEEGNIFSGNGTGQLVVRKDDPCMFLGYWDKPQLTGEQFKGDWLLSGDEVTKDDEGYLWFKSRMDDLIMSAGYRISPIEIENNLMKHPAVAKAGVVAAPDLIRGQMVKAFIQLAEGNVASLELKSELQDFIKFRVAAYAYPREIEIIDEIPLTVTGKVNRRELRFRAYNQALSGNSQTRP